MQQVVYLVRHGESEWNVRGLTQGQIAHPRLTARGREQAEVAGAELLGRVAPDVSWGRVLVSDLARACETGEIIASRLGLPVAIDPRLRERHFGEWQGRDYALAASWVAADPDTHRRPVGGESAAEVRSRALAVLGSLDRSVVNVVVTHGEVLRSLAPPGEYGAGQPGVVRNGAVLEWCGT